MKWNKRQRTNKMRYEAVIFDLDGVLCHTDKYHYMAWKEIAGELGISFSRKINDRMRGVSRVESLEILLENFKGHLSWQQKEFYAEKKNRVYRCLLKNLSEKDLEPEVKQTLDMIKASGIKIAVGSSSRNAKLILEQLGLSGFFDAVADGTDITRSKPNPEVFLKAAEFLGIEPKSCLVVEDAVAGLAAAGAAGMDCAVTANLKNKANAEHYLDRFSDLLFIL